MDKSAPQNLGEDQLSACPSMCTPHGTLVNSLPSLEEAVGQRAQTQPFGQGSGSPLQVAQLQNHQPESN